MMVSEALELRVYGGRVSHGWHMGVVNHGYGGLFRSRDAGGGLYAHWTKPGVLVACREMPEHFPSVM